MRGFVYMLESILTAVIVMSFLLVISGHYLSVTQPDNLAEKGYLILKGLDNRDEVRNYTVAMDYEGLNDLIPVYNYNHTVQICNSTISCAGVRPNASEVWTANYIIAGNNDYQPFVVRLYFSPM